MSIYNTNYEKYSQSQLTALFSSDTWGSLSFSQRINACQEIENRYAAENNVQPCLVTHQPMNGNYYGWQSGNTICLNSYLLQDGQFCTTFKDANGNSQTVRTNVLAPGWNTLETIYHEGTHGIQEQTGKTPSTYISSEMDSALYRIQGIEKEAYASGQTKTLEALSNYENKVGHLDAGHDEYISSVKADSFQSALIDASHNYNDPNIEQTLQDVITDRENGISRANASESYKAIYNLCDSYDIRSSLDLSSVVNTSTLYNTLDNKTESINLQTETQQEDGLSYANQGISIENQLGDGLSDTNATESTNHQTETHSFEDGSIELTTSNYSDAVFTDDGMNNSEFDIISTDQDDGLLNSDAINDYGSSKQPYSTDGLDDSNGLSSDFYQGEVAFSSNESDYSE